MWNKKEDITIDPTNIKRIIREYYEQIYANKFNNLDKLSDSLMDTNYQSSLKKKIDNLKIPAPVKEIRFVDKNLTTHAH